MLPPFSINFSANAAPDEELELVDTRYRQSRVIGAHVQEHRGRPREHKQSMEYQFSDYWKARGVNNQR